MEPIIEFHSPQEGVAPMYACGNCRMLGSIIDRNNDQEAARKCCVCPTCGERPKQQYRTECVECEQLTNILRNAKKRERLNALPCEEYDGGPVYANDRFESDLDSLLDHFDEDDLPTLVVYPCAVCKVEAPDLASYVEDYLADQFQDADGPYLSDKEEKALADVAESLTFRDSWVPMTKVRLRRTWADEVA